MHEIEKEYKVAISDIEEYFEATWKEAVTLRLAEAQEKYSYKKTIKRAFNEALKTLEKIIRSHVGENISVTNTPYMDDEILRISSALGPAEVFANPSIKHLYDSLFPPKKDRMVLDLSFKPDITVVMENAKSSGIKISRIVKGIYLAARVYFINVKKDKQEAEYLQEVLNNTRYSTRMRNYICDYFINHNLIQASVLYSRNEHWKRLDFFHELEYWFQ